MRRLKMPSKNMSFWVAILLSVAAGVSILFALYQLYLPAKVLVPIKDIAIGTQINQADLGYITTSKRDRHPKAVSDAKQVIGKYAAENLYAKEPILTPKLSVDVKAGSEIARSISKEETYITLKPNQAQWPAGMKTGDYVTALGVNGAGVTLLGEKIRILRVSGETRTAGQIEALKNTVIKDEEGITLVLKWTQVGPFYDGRAASKELWIVPEHPDKQTGLALYNQMILELKEAAAKKKPKAR